MRRTHFSSVWFRHARRFVSSKLQEEPGLRDFILDAARKKKEAVGLSPRARTVAHHSLSGIPSREWGQGVTVEVATYGCQMNVSDSEVVESLLVDTGFHVERWNGSDPTTDAILVNTCAIREGAETKVLNKLREWRAVSRKRRKDLVVGVLGCMAERMKTTLLEGNLPLADLVVGPDAYRDLPFLLASVVRGKKESDSDQREYWGYNVQLSLDETYADVVPVRRSGNGITAYVSIMRGCDNLCSYCIVPFTRGRERSRPMDSILSEVRQLSDEGYREVTLLGQNVNSYNDQSTADKDSDEVVESASGFKTIYKPKRKGRMFPDLLDHVSRIDPKMRIRFTSPHPKDFQLELLDLIRERSNICRQVHVPLQSGSSEVLDRMRRGYDQEAYLALIEEIRSRIPNVSISTDIIAGFCGETDADHAETLKVMRQVQFDQAFMFAYSERSSTHASRHLRDDVPPEEKQRRLSEIISLFYELVKSTGASRVGEISEVLVESLREGPDTCATGRSDRNQRIFFSNTLNAKLGDYVKVQTISTNGVSAKGQALSIVDARKRV